LNKPGLAEQACNVEIDVLKEPIGKQDQYAAAFGGLNYIQFQKTGNVVVEPIALNQKELNTITENLHLFYLGGSRSASEILSSYNKSDRQKDVYKQSLSKLADDLRDKLLCGDITAFGEILDKGWEIKKKMSSRISSPLIDEIYEKAISNGAIGGKLLGAGGNGFILLYIEKNNIKGVKEQLNDLREIPFTFEWDGSSIIYNNQ